MAHLSRKASLISLIVSALLVGVLFFRVVQPFLFPVFLAAVLALLFQPLYARIVSGLGGRTRIGAAVTTFVILLAVLLPLSVALLFAGQELIATGRAFLEVVESDQQPELTEHLDELERLLTEAELAQLRSKIVAGVPPAEALSPTEHPEAYRVLGDLDALTEPEELRAAFQPSALLRWLSQQGNAHLGAFWDEWGVELTGERLKDIEASSSGVLQDVVSEVYDKTRSFIVNFIEFLIGFVIMVLSLYYFFAEGPRMLRTIQQLSPLDDRDEEQLFYQFDTVCRSVVLATVVSALVQAVLAGIGFAVAGVERVWLLMSVTMFLSMIPFLGAAAVWIPVCLLLAIEERYTASVLLACYSGAIVSTSDNVIKTYVIQGQAKLHPLLVLISLLGALRVVGLWGIFLGPILAAFFYALLRILNQRLDQPDEPDVSGTMARGALAVEQGPAPALPPRVSGDPPELQ